MHDGKYRADKDERDDDVKMALSLPIIFLKLKSEIHARLSSSFVILPITRMQQCAQTKDPGNA